ncbi:MAG: PHP domain-containing protein [Defluviitaleaceae bacterium]|nr:PHP domain-containing protein [Defluviitaleaceae bacterium]MCL2239003.1 PHP domain-containing protein [Defluviitaleaceae bacterium]
MINNHIHTIYSFSPYTPATAVRLAKENGLQTAGIMDHDSVAGLREFIRAGQEEGIGVTVGFELRTCFKGTPFAGRRINNPDQDSVAYLAMHGIPHDKIDAADAFLKPYREARNIRNRRMTEKLDAFVRGAGLAMDFDKDVLPLSQHEKGGSVTERHILFALAEKTMGQVAPGPATIAFLKDHFGIEARGKNLQMLSDSGNAWYAYYLLGVLKADMMAHFYLDADAELPDYKNFISLAEEIGAIPAYAYLGDVGDSITGDKKTQKFEDEFLDELIIFLKEAGFRAITYMPARNTSEQLARLITLCEQHEIFEICGEDINSPFQPFVCKELERAEYKHLVDAAWALIGHEKAGFGAGLFSQGAIHNYPALKERVKHFANMGRAR